jgi:hypothetical protein
MPRARVEAESMYVLRVVVELTVPELKLATILRKMGLSASEPMWATMTSFSLFTRVFLANVELTIAPKKVGYGMN